MNDKNRTVILGVVVGLFIIANIIAGIAIYKRESTRATPQKQAAQVGETVKNGKPEQEVKALDTEVKASEQSVAETGAQKVSEEAAAGAEIEEKSTAQSGEDPKPETGTDQSEQQLLIAAYESEKSGLEKEIARLQEALRDKQILAAENKKLSEQIREFSAERKRLQKEIAVGQTNYEKYKEVSAQNEKLAKQIKEYSKETNHYKNEISTLQKRLDQYKGLVSQKKKLQAQLGDAKRQNEALKARLDKIRTIIERD